MFAQNVKGLRGLVAGAAALAVAVVGGAWLAGSATAQPTGNRPAQAEPLVIGEPAPDFTLVDMEGKRHRLSEYTKQGKIVVLEWFNPGCPFVVKFYHNGLDAKPTHDMAAKYKDKDVVWLLVNSTHTGHQDFPLNASKVAEWEVKHPVLMDSDGKVGRMYSARTTPHMYIIHRDGTLAYQGAIDSNRGRNPAQRGDQTVNYVGQALEQLVAGETVTTAETRPYGCSIKYAE